MVSDFIMVRFGFIFIKDLERPGFSSHCPRAAVFSMSKTSVFALAINFSTSVQWGKSVDRLFI